jgi:hypothetical protein
MAVFTNSAIEALLTEEPSVTHEHVFDTSALADLKKVALDFLEIKELNVPDDKSFWCRKGGIHKNKYIQNLSETYLKKFLPRQDVELIGDTAFIINFPPHDIHIDCKDFRTNEKHKGIIGYKSLVIPIEISCDVYPTFYTANQYFYGPSTRFRAGSEFVDLHSPESNRQKAAGIQFSYNYKQDGMKYISETNLSKEWYDANIDAQLHNPYSNFRGISIEKEHQWKPGNIIVFDSSRIHFAQNILKCGAKFKIGISLNYGIRTNI